MADNIPFEIQMEIMKRLPVKSLLQFRTVSKQWKSLISSSKFIADHSICQAQPQRLLIRYRLDTSNRHYYKYEHKYISIVDNDNFPQQKFATTIPVPVKLNLGSFIVGCSHGLFCVYVHYKKPGYRGPTSGSDMAVLWNPSIRKSIAVALPNFLDYPYQTFVAFGVRPDTCEAKMVKITHIINLSKHKSSIPYQVEVFTLSSGVWRIPCTKLPRKSVKFSWSHVTVGRFIYWDAFEWIAKHNGFRCHIIIVSFDMITEEFGELYLPHTLADGGSLSICNLRDSLVVLDHCCSSTGVWMLMMDQNNTKSFIKLYNIESSNAFIKTLGFNISYGDMIGRDEHCLHENYSKHISDLGIPGNLVSFSIKSYQESLLLLNQSNNMFCFDKKDYILTS